MRCARGRARKVKGRRVELAKAYNEAVHEFAAVKAANQSEIVVQGRNGADDGQQRQRDRSIRAVRYRPAYVAGGVMTGKLSPDLETEICDLADMASVANMVVDLLLQEIVAVAGVNMTALQLADHVDRWKSAAAFTVAQTNMMALRLREKCYPDK